MDDADEYDNAGSSGGCHMCLAIPGKIIEISPDNPESALVDVVTVRRRVDLGLLQDDRPQPGDWVLIHVGFAMSKISEQDAHDQMETLRMLGESEAALQEVEGYGLEETSAPEPVEPQYENQTGRVEKPA
jgi:hydrogenase expression/formation protein HypC